MDDMRKEFESWLLSNQCLPATWNAAEVKVVGWLSAEAEIESTEKPA